jgi:hypothetical protein
MNGDGVRRRAVRHRTEHRPTEPGRTEAGSPGAVAHAVLLGGGAGRMGPVLPDQRADGGMGCGRIATSSVDRTTGRRAAGVTGHVTGYATRHVIGYVTLRDRPAVDCTRSGPCPQGHNPRSIHYSPVLLVPCAGGEMLR